MIRDLAEETVDGSAFDDFSASLLLTIIGRQVGFFKVPIIRDLAEKQLMDQHLIIAGFFYVGNNQETGWGYV